MNTVRLPTAAPAPVRQPSRAAALFRRDHPWPGTAGAAGAYAQALQGVRAAKAAHRRAARAMWSARAREDACGGPPWQGEAIAAQERTFATYREWCSAVRALAMVPAPDCAALSVKARRVADLWPDGRGDAFPALREALARDAARLGVAIPLTVRGAFA